MAIYITNCVKTAYTPGYDLQMTDANWITSVCGNASADVKHVYSDVPDNTISHSGLVSYLFTCWRDEAGVSLRPDMIAGVILNQIASEVCAHPELYSHLYIDSPGKKTIVVTGFDDLSIDKLTEVVTGLIREPILSKAFTTDYPDAPPGYHMYSRMCVLQSATPYFNYMSRWCGIPVVELLGGADGWRTLHHTISSLRPIFNIEYKNKETIEISPIVRLIDQTLNVISSVLYFGYNIGTVRYEKYSNATEFFGDIFNITERCGSGGPYYHSGWFSQLFIVKSKMIDTFTQCVAYVPFEDVYTRDMWFYASGLVYSVVGKCDGVDCGIYRPEYGSVKYQVFDRTLFNRIAKK